MEESANFVLDSYALIGYLEGEKFADQIHAMLMKARNGLCRIYLHALHVGEAYYITYRQSGPDMADLAYARIKAFPVA